MTDQETAEGYKPAASSQRPAGVGDFAAAAAALGVKVATGEPLARHTTFRIGGPADLYAVATTGVQLEQLAELAAEHGIPATILGGGSNVLVSDAGVRGLVIANQTRGVEWRTNQKANQRIGGFHGEAARSANRRSNPQLTAGSSTPSATAQLIAESGMTLARLARLALRAGLAGLEWAVSVPGTVGGAVIGNAGAHGGDIASNLAWVRVAYPGSGQQTLAASEMGFAYRSSVLKRQLAGAGGRPVVLAAAFDLTPGEPTELEARADGFLARRRSSQPTEPSAGSIFRNPAGDYAGRLIDAAGLKGYIIGGAQISPRHANFIVNVGGAKAANVTALMDLVRRRVHEGTGIELLPEILFLGDWRDQEGLEPLPFK